jgi:hypothetical protein
MKSAAAVVLSLAVLCVSQLVVESKGKWTWNNSVADYVSSGEVNCGGRAIR